MEEEETKTREKKNPVEISGRLFSKLQSTSWQMDRMNGWRETTKEREKDDEERGEGGGVREGKKEKRTEAKMTSEFEKI